MSTPALLRTEVFNNGPVVVAIDCYSDMMTYKGGVY